MSKCDAWNNLRIRGLVAYLCLCIVMLHYFKGNRPDALWKITFFYAWWLWNKMLYPMNGSSFSLYILYIWIVRTFHVCIGDTRFTSKKLFICQKTVNRCFYCPFIVILSIYYEILGAIKVSSRGLELYAHFVCLLSPILWYWVKHKQNVRLTLECWVCCYRWCCRCLWFFREKKQEW